MWQILQKEIDDSTRHYQFADANQQPLSFANVVDLWAGDGNENQLFRLFTSLTLASSLFPTFRWETPVVDHQHMDREFEFILRKSKLHPTQNPAPFQKHLDGLSDALVSPQGGVIEFPNLGRNAVLVVPRVSEAVDVNHSHLASFLRTADQNHCADLWQMVGLAMRRRTGANEQPVWLNTAGGGVAWLHVRLDDRPKYYSYAPYKVNDLE